MSRLIDADELLKHKYHDSNRYENAVACYYICNAPTVDAVEVVRCKDCKHYHVETYLLYGDYETLEWCDLLNIRGKIPPDPKPMDFCSYGERKEADHE